MSSIANSIQIDNMSPLQGDSIAQEGIMPGCAINVSGYGEDSTADLNSADGGYSALFVAKEPNLVGKGTDTEIAEGDRVLWFMVARGQRFNARMCEGQEWGDNTLIALDVDGNFRVAGEGSVPVAKTIESGETGDNETALALAIGL